MMLSHRVVIFSFLNLIAFIDGQVFTPKQFNRGEFLGDWNVVRMMVPKSACYPIIECVKLQINPRYSERKFTERSWQIENGVPNWTVMTGEIIDSEIYYMNPGDKNTTVMTVTKYNNGDELILLSQDNKSFSRLLSRHRTASLGTIRVFRNIARASNMQSVTIEYDDCL